jgi:tRNA (cmo5U34)-methyltransferase
MKNTSQISASVGDQITAKRSAWDFSGDTPRSFVSHISRSVPLYAEGHDLVCRLSDFFIQPGSLGLELGVSTGELIAKLAQYNGHKENVRWLGIDIEEAMIEEARRHCTGLENVELLVDDITTADFVQGLDFVVCYYTIQFLPPRLRQPLFDKIFASLNWGGALVLFEKVRAPDARFQDITTALYDDFKQEQGFSETEIMAKRRSLRGVLEPYSTAANLDYLERAGFRDYLSMMKYVCFEGFLAIK